MQHSYKAYGKEHIVKHMPPCREAVSMVYVGNTIGPGVLNKEYCRNDQAVHGANDGAGNTQLVGPRRILTGMEQ